MQKPGSTLGLRQTVALAALLLSILSVGVAGSLIVLTTGLHDTTTALRDAVRVVRIGRQMEVDLLVRDRLRDPGERARLDESLQAVLQRTEEQRVPLSSRSRAVREQAAAAIDRYLAIPPGPETRAEAAEALEEAQDCIDALVHSVAEDADRARAGADRLDRLGDAIGITSALLMLAVPALLLWWMRQSVAQPMLALSSTMDRFGKGDLSVRAPIRGAAEIQRMSAQFNAMGEALQLQHEARLAHLAGVAHDLRNPLAALRLSVGLVDATGPPLDPATARAFSIVRRQVDRLTRMVEDLLDATRIEAGRLSLVVRRSDLRASVRATAELFENASPLHRLVVELPNEPLLVDCDAVRVEQTLNNLVSNAIKYSPRGGEVRIVARQEENAAVVSVTDQGLGIPAQEVDKIWQPFRRRGVSAEDVSGVGLGLWIAKKIAEAHGGHLSVKTEVSGGSTFTLTLPLAPPEPEPRPAALQPVPSHG